MKRTSGAIMAVILLQLALFAGLLALFIHLFGGI
jgi:hypothetical protein